MAASISYAQVLKSNTSIKEFNSSKERLQRLQLIKNGKYLNNYWNLYCQRTVVYQYLLSPRL